MPPFVIVMAILGCADDGAQCQLVHRLPTTYPTVAACNMAAEAELERLGNLDYPTIMARCQADPGAKLADSANHKGR